MVNVISKTCLEEGCNKGLSYNLEGEKKGLYCQEYKKNGIVDVKNKACLEEGCKKNLVII